MKTKEIQFWRWIVKYLQATIIIGLPFLKVKGESALRFDIPELRLHFFGVSLWVGDFFIILIATIFLTFLIMLITLLFGRIWCGWLCPQTVIGEFTGFIDKAKDRGSLYKLFSYFAAFLISAAVAANLIWYFVSPYEFIAELISSDIGDITRTFWIVLTIIIFLNFIFLRRKFCATVCPYSMLQSVMYDDKTLVIAFDQRREKECINCMSCVKTCPVSIDIRKGLNVACVNCAKCVDKCTEIMTKRGRSTLVGYFWGLPEKLVQAGAKRILRQNAIMIGFVTAAFFTFLMYLSLTLLPVSMTIIPNHNFLPRITADETVINSYLLAIKNRGNIDMELEIKVKDMEGIMKINPNMVVLKAGEHRRFPVYVTVKNFGNNELTEGIKSISILLRSKEPNKVTITREASFIIMGDLI